MTSNYFTIIMFLVLTSCFSDNKDEDQRQGIQKPDPFYTDIGDFGSYLRIPLIKPYEINKVTALMWATTLQTPNLLEM